MRAQTVEQLNDSFRPAAAGGQGEEDGVDLDPFPMPSLPNLRATAAGGGGRRREGEGRRGGGGGRRRRKCGGREGGDGGRERGGETAALKVPEGDPGMGLLAAALPASQAPDVFAGMG